MAFGANSTTRLALVQDQALDQHETDEGLAETDPIAQEGAAVLPGDLHERPVRLLLVAIEARKHARVGFIPLGRRQFVATEELLQRLRVDVKRRIVMRMARDRVDDGLVDPARLVPVLLEPLLQLRDFARALDLDVEFRCSW